MLSLQKKVTDLFTFASIFMTLYFCIIFSQSKQKRANVLKKNAFDLTEWDYETIEEDSETLNTTKFNFDNFSRGTQLGPINVLAKVMLSKTDMSVTYASKTVEFSKVLPNEMLDKYRNCWHSVLAQSEEPKQVLFECRNKVGMSLAKCRQIFFLFC